MPDSAPVTVVIAQQVKPGHEAEYEAWMSGIAQVASTYPGHLGVNQIRPHPGVRSEYVTIFRFDSYEHLKAWMTSRDRQFWLDKAQPLIAANPQVQQISGVEAWFSIPGKVLRTPPRYKTALLTGTVVYILINLLNRFVTPFLRGLPAWLGSFLYRCLGSLSSCTPVQVPSSCAQG
ncbi:antibiotic biosynthesis monooxygenase [filamentous cyanobacterium CCP5]|nr:antibiotic biosynthesis monooxygenase [filamentous cyanobacterium CCP5]